MLPYAIVEFVLTNTVAIISTGWFVSDEEEECLWPPACNSSKVKKMVQTSSVPTESWKKFSVRVLGKASDFKKAETKLLQAEVTSDLQTDSVDEEGPTSSKRRPKPNQWHELDAVENNYVISSDSDSDGQHSDLLPPPPSFSLARRTPHVVAPVTSTCTTPLSHITSVASPCPSPLAHRTTPVVTSPHQAREHTGGSTPLRPHHTEPATPSEDTSVDLRLKTIERMMIRLLSLVQEMKETQRVHKSLLDTLVRNNVNGVDHAMNQLPDGIHFPVSTMEGFEVLEAALQEASAINHTAAFLSDIGGRTIDEAIRRIMAHVFTNEMSMKFNLIGRHGKRAICSTRVFEVVYKAIKKNARTTNINQKEFEKALSKWLSGGRDRDGNRAKRALSERMRRDANQTP